jgi:hypothetical protein
MARTHVVLMALAGLEVLSSTACNERFEYDIPRGGAGTGGTGAAGQSVGGSAVAGGGMAGAAPARCGTGPACPSQLHCVEGACTQCEADADCSAFGLLRCQPELRRCVECLATSDCPADFSCDVVAYRCLRTCGPDLPCPPDAHGCDEERMVCYACDEDRECEDSPLGSFCAADGSGCAPCRGTEGCATDQLCDELSGACVECRDGSDCDSGLCDPHGHTCLSPPP